MEPGESRALTTLSVGRWLVVESRGIPDTYAGDTLNVVQDPRGSWGFTKERVGRIATISADGMTLTPGEDEVVVESTVDGVWIRLVPDEDGLKGRTVPALRDGEQPATLTRMYRGQPEVAAGLMRRDAERLSAQGYVAVSQNYYPGHWSGGAWVFAFLLFVLIIGIFIAVYMIAAKPDGTLTVVYERRVAAGAPASTPGPTDRRAPTPGSLGTIEERLIRLEDLHARGVVTDEEHAAKRAAILAEI